MLAALLGQCVRHQSEGSFCVGHSRLDGLQLLLGGVDGGMLAHDMPIVTALWPAPRLWGELRSSRVG